MLYFFISPATYVLTVRSHSNKIAGYSYILSFRLAYCTPRDHHGFVYTPLRHTSVSHLTLIFQSSPTDLSVIYN